MIWTASSKILCRAVTGRSQTAMPGGAWVKRDTATRGGFLDHEADGDPFKGRPQREVGQVA
jgi:hypothetical protein